MYTKRTVSVCYILCKYRFFAVVLHHLSFSNLADLRCGFCLPIVGFNMTHIKPCSHMSQLFPIQYACEQRQSKLWLSAVGVCFWAAIGSAVLDSGVSRCGKCSRIQACDWLWGGGTKWGGLVGEIRKPHCSIPPRISLHTD